MKSLFGERIRELRVQRKMLLRQVAPFLEMDTALLSKIEKGVRHIKREQIFVLANILDTDENQLQILWLADQVYEVVKDEKFATEAIQIAENSINQKMAEKSGN